MHRQMNLQSHQLPPHIVSLSGCAHLSDLRFQPVACLSPLVALPLQILLAQSSPSQDVCQPSGSYSHYYPPDQPQADAERLTDQPHLLLAV